MTFRDAGIEAVVFDWGGTLSTFATSVRVQELWNPAAAALEPHTTHSHEEIAACLAATEDAFWERTATHQRAGTLADIVAEAHERLGADVPGDALDAAALAYLDAWAPHIEHDIEAASTIEAQQAGAAIRAQLVRIAGPPGDAYVAGPAGVRAGLEAIRAGDDINYEGAATPIDWTAAGDVTSGFIEIYGYRDGALVTIEVQPFTLE